MATPMRNLMLNQSLADYLRPEIPNSTPIVTNPQAPFRLPILERGLVPYFFGKPPMTPYRPRKRLPMTPFFPRPEVAMQQMQQPFFNAPNYINPYHPHRYAQYEAMQDLPGMGRTQIWPHREELTDMLMPYLNEFLGGIPNATERFAAKAPPYMQPMQVPEAPRAPMPQMPPMQELAPPMPPAPPAPPPPPQAQAPINYSRTRGFRPPGAFGFRA